MTRGFTGHEMLDDTDLVQMNGRIYDPSLGKFLSPDPFIQDKYLGASLNRFSYVWNNPLSYTDPSGYFVGAFFAATKLAVHAFAAYQVYQEIPAEVRPYLAIAFAVVFQQYYLPALQAAGVPGYLAAGIGGGTTSVIATGKPKAFLTGFGQGAVTFGIGSHFDGAEGFAAGAQKAVAHGVSGGVFAEIGGASFSSGFLAAGFTDVAHGFVEFNDVVAGTAYSAVVGGVGSELGGGKFADGAQTGAFTYLFNELSHRGRSLKAEEFTRPPNEDLESLLARIDGADSTDVIDLYNSELTMIMQSDLWRGDMVQDRSYLEAALFADGQFFKGDRFRKTFRIVNGPIAGTYLGSDVNYYVNGFTAAGYGMTKSIMNDLIVGYNTSQALGFSVYRGGAFWSSKNVSPRNFRQIGPATQFGSYGYDFYRQNR